MTHAQPVEPIDTRLALRSYAAAAGLGGFTLAAWGPGGAGVITQFVDPFIVVAVRVAYLPCR